MDFSDQALDHLTKALTAFSFEDWHEPDIDEIQLLTDEESCRRFRAVHPLRREVRLMSIEESRDLPRLQTVQQSRAGYVVLKPKKAVVAASE